MTNSTIEVEILNSVDKSSYPTIFSIKRKDVALSEIIMSLNYPMPSNVSISNEPDRLRVKNIKSIQIIKKNIFTILNEGVSAEANIPR